MAKRGKTLTVRQAADLLGVTATTLRNWDKSGKLVPKRNPSNGYRLYSVEDVSSIVAESSEPYTRTPTSQFERATDILDMRTFRRIIRQMSAEFRNSQGGGLLERFEEITKLLYTKLYDERQSTMVKGYVPNFVVGNTESTELAYSRLVALYEEAIRPIAHLTSNGRATLSDDKQAVVRVAMALQTIELLKSEAEVKGAAFEELVRNTFEKTENQQFFTPRVVVDFMAHALGIGEGQTVCDPACGTGGFLVGALGASPRIGHLLGIEIDRRMAWVTQMNLMLHSGDQARVLCEPNSGSLGNSKILKAEIPKEGFDFIITNPPFGSDFTDAEALGRFQLGSGRSSRRRGALFVERCIDWLKPGEGRMAIVLDDSILNGPANADVRALLLRKCHLEAVISLPEVAFKPYASVETSIIFLRKRAIDDHSANQDVFMAIAKEVGKKPNGDPLTIKDANGRTVLHNDLDSILKAWFKYRGKKRLEAASDITAFVRGGKNFFNGQGGENRLDVLYHHPTREAAELTLRRSKYQTYRLAELVDVRNDSLVPRGVDPFITWRYVGLAQIQPRTGEYSVSEVAGDDIKSAVRRFEAGDVVFSKLRPELRKCFVADGKEEDAFVSSECFVLTPKGDQGSMRGRNARLFNEVVEVDGEYLAFILRSDLVFGQLVFQITGTGRPRLSKESVLNVKVPLPPVSVQHQVVKAYKDASRLHQAHRERSRAELVEGEKVLRRVDEYATKTLC